jgi:hypothetical protein
MSPYKNWEDKMLWQRIDRKLHPEKQKRYVLNHNHLQRKYRNKIRMKIIELLGGKCVRCGFSDIRALQIDHVNGDGYKDRRRYNCDVKYRKTLKEIKDGSKRYQLLCANCNWIKRWENKEWVYGNGKID